MNISPRISRIKTIGLFLLVCLSVFESNAYADIISSNSISALYIAHEADTLGTSVESEINNTQFQKQLFAAYKKSPFDPSVLLVAKVELSMEGNEELGLLSISLDVKNIPREIARNAFKRVEYYTKLRASGYSKEYVTRLMFKENITKATADLDRFGQAIVKKYPNVLPSKLKRIGDVNTKSEKRISFEIRDTKYRWRYDVYVGQNGTLEDIVESAAISIINNKR